MKYRVIAFLVIIIGIVLFFAKNLNFSESYKKMPENTVTLNDFNLDFNKEKKIEFRPVRDIFKSPLKKRDIILKSLRSYDFSLRLEGIFTGKNKFAIINGNVYKEGDNINNMILKRIEKNKVIFDNGKTLTME